MTNYNKSTLATFFAQGDVPQGTDYANLINSQVNLVETTIQAMAGPLSTTELDTPLVSATNVNITTLLSAAALNVAGAVSAASVNVTGDLRATAGSVYVSALRPSTGIIATSIPIVSATGTARATAAPVTSYITRGQGVTDGQATGFQLPAPTVGWEQKFIYEGAVSANLWPIGTDYQINAITSGNPFPLVANTMYYVIHKTTSAYAVK